MCTLCTFHFQGTARPRVLIGLGMVSSPGLSPFLHLDRELERKDMLVHLSLLQPRGALQRVGI